MTSFLESSYRQFIFYRTYSRWNDELKRRESWEEVVKRYFDFMREKIGDKLSEREYEELQESVLSQSVMPSMRLAWYAGKAARKSNVAGYNCAFIAPTKFQDFGEILYLLSSTCGVGFSVESKFVSQFPEVQEQSGKSKKYVVDDSREGWADALVTGITAWFNGEDYEFDYSKLRPAGARLKTMGGRSSGADPLRNLLDFAKVKILAKQGKKLLPIDVHDIVCKIGEVVVAGGVRRSAEISLSDLTDKDIRDAKKGAFYFNEPQRSLANNSAVYNEKPPLIAFIREWTALIESGSGERGIFNRGGIESQMPDRRLEAMNGHIDSTGTNPCGEITLRNKEFCNLTEVVARAGDTSVDLLEKVKVATILGTYQSMLTDFGYLSKEWKKNCEEERLLGVSITGQFDSKEARNPTTLKTLRDYAVKINKKYAKRFGVNQSLSVTTVKPSGTVSQLVDASSGMHPRHSPYYIRRVRIASTDPLFLMLKAQGMNHTPEVGQVEATATTFVLEFPIKAPKGSITGDGMTAIEQLEYWKIVKENYTEHNPSQTVSVGEDEWLETGAWVWKNWEIVGGFSFLPRTNHVYALAPYEAITKERYDGMVAKMPEIDYSKLSDFEYEDNTEGAGTSSCIGNVCEVV